MSLLAKKILGNSGRLSSFSYHKYGLYSIITNQRSQRFSFSTSCFLRDDVKAESSKENDKLRENRERHLKELKEREVIREKTSFQTRQGSPMNWYRLGVGAVIIGICTAAFSFAKSIKDQKIYMQRNRSVGKADIGGTFELIDHTGKKTTGEDFNGKWVLLYFGFTHCPDICPDEMEKMAEVYDILEDEKKTDSVIKEIIPLFITVDPARDGVKEVAEYIKEFHPKMIGLTGSMDAITKAAKNYRVYFSAGPADSDNDYIVDHTIIMYLISPDGDFLDYYGRSRNSEKIAKAIKDHMYRYEKINNPNIIDRIRNYFLGDPKEKSPTSNYG